MADTQTPGAQGTNTGAAGAAGGDGAQAPAALDLNAVNSVFTSRSKRERAEILGEVEKALAPIRELMAGLQPKAPEGHQQAAGEGVNPAASVAAPDPRITAYEKKLAALEAKGEKLEAERAAERKQALGDKAYASLRAELTSSGKIRAEAIDTVADLIFHARKRVQVGDDGVAKYVIDGIEYDLKAGVQEFIKSPESALFQPPPTAQQKRPLTKTPVRPGPSPEPGKRPMGRASNLAAALEAAGVKISQ